MAEARGSFTPFRISSGVMLRPTTRNILLGHMLLFLHGDTTIKVDLSELSIRCRRQRLIAQDDHRESSVRKQDGFIFLRSMQHVEDFDRIVRNAIEDQV